MINLSNGLAGLSLLSGNNSFLSFGAGAVGIETRAVRQARAQFTLPETTPPWRDTAKPTPVSAQVSAVKRLGSIIDKPAMGAAALPDDVGTAFRAYKALERLRILADGAAKTSTSASERASLQAVFVRGLEDLESFLGTAPSDVLQLAFAQPARRAESLALVAPSALLGGTVLGKGVAASRTAALPGLTGDEKFSIALSRPGAADTITVDLAGTTRPPTLDSVSAAINAAIMAVQQRNADGTVFLDAQGQTQPAWAVRFTPDKSSGTWGLAVTRTSTETVAIDQIGAGDALMVATGMAAPGVPGTVRMLRFDEPDGTLAQRTLGTIAGIDADATERAKIAAAAAGNVFAQTTAAAIATDAQGFSYVVGTTSGDLGDTLADGEDLFLSKLDSEGAVIWQRALGAAGRAQGAAVSVAANGDVVVAGTVTGGLDGANSDGDMLVARFDASGNEEFATLVRAAGADAASAIAVGADGTVFVGGKSAAGDAFIARLDAGGRLAERRTIDSGGTDGVTALAVDDAGNLLALTREGTEAKLRRLDGTAISTDLASINLGTADARALARADDGSIAVVGATSIALGGTQVNATGGGRDGFVARIDAGLSMVSVTYLATADDDQLDSAAFMNGALYVGGRTTGALDGARRGALDGFVSRIDAATGAVQSNRQFGQPAARTEPVRLAAARGGNTVLGALGLHRGTITPELSAKLVSQTALRAGDEFSVRLEGGVLRKIVIGADDTLTTLADRIRRITGLKATVSTPKNGDGNVLRIDMKAGFTAELVAGANGKDALAKLGLPAARISSPDVVAANAPKVRPGGSFGLNLTGALGIGTAVDAKIALARVKAAISVTQTGYRSLYWDDGKAAIVNGRRGGTGASTAREQAQLTQYQAALDRLSGSGGTSSSTGF